MVAAFSRMRGHGVAYQATGCGYYSLASRPESSERCRLLRRRACLLGIVAPVRIGCPSSGAQVKPAPLTGYATPGASGGRLGVAIIAGASILGNAMTPPRTPPVRGYGAACLSLGVQFYQRSRSAPAAAATLISADTPYQPQHVGGDHRIPHKGLCAIQPIYCQKVC